MYISRHNPLPLYRNRWLKDAAAAFAGSMSVATELKSTGLCLVHERPMYVDKMWKEPHAKLLMHASILRHSVLECESCMQEIRMQLHSKPIQCFTCPSMR
jgi:hypothetical protein